MSFFTGAGGLDLGFEQAGFQTIYATDNDQRCCDTLRLNVGNYLSAGMKIQEADILSLDPKTLPPDIDLIIGGPPCQTFSASGRRAGGAPGRLDGRGMLFEAYCGIIEHVRPKAFVFENVRGILGTNKGADWTAIVAAFGKLGYTLSYRLLDALDYGVPQQRERMFLVGHQLDRPFLFPEPTHGPDARVKQPHISTKEAFEGIVETERLSDLKLTGGKYSHLLSEVPPGQNYLFFTAKRGHPRPIFAYRSRFSDFLYKANPDAPVKTIIASPGKYTGPLHWDNRYFSIQEYRRIQGFPDDYKFSGSRDDVIRQIGNSVSPRIAYRLALAIAAQVFNIPNDVRLLRDGQILSFDSRKGAKAQRTRAMHLAIIRAAPAKVETLYFKPASYTARVEPSSTEPHAANVFVKAVGQHVSIRLETDNIGIPFARMQLRINQTARRGPKAPTIVVVVEANGESAGTAQAMWNVVDDWVRRSSDFHSLFELYGHFTEPHPMFSVESFVTSSQHPAARFAVHAAEFTNCSRYLPKSELVELFGKALSTTEFNIVAEYLRGYRFDIRSRETNIAIPPDVYMVAYPFNLPPRRQMNFRVRDRDELGRAAAV